MSGGSDRRLALGLLAAGLIGLVASTTLLIERLRLAGDEEYVPTCSLNPVLSCGSIMESAQASLLGFPNPVIGVAGFPVVLATGAALLAGARLARWYWMGLQVGATAALALVGWLAFQSLYRIGALCPYCMVVWAVVVPLFYYVTVRNLAQGVLGAAMADSAITRTVRDWHAPVLLLVFVGVLALVAVQFWSYWSTLW
ncbi:vitamin K epoxide reductase family protein [Nocardioides sp. 31GB23]|uniref:vitamin K epoxide reductase family protein n=1 Tax=Nocardioides sp. 31GB23 TaxID=3156065 RepID=UPI0032AF17FD